MSFVYLDSSVLVALALADVRGSQALHILGSRDACSSVLCQVECQSALSFEYRSAPSGLTTPEKAVNTVLARVQMIQVTAAVLVQARTLVRRHRVGLGLRTLDAVHLASCIEIRAQLGAAAVEYITADQRQHHAFTAEGFSGTLLP